MFKMNKISTLILLTSLITINLYSQTENDSNFRFPLNIPATVTGSFGELRAAHFHSGIDFATNQTIGQPVYSIDDGYISRVFVSHSGYGKAIYINHPNGYTSVYGHLDEFNSDMEKFVLNNQYKKESFSIDFYFKAGEMPVKKGDFIGKSGNTGNSGGPHLHFEIRETASQKPLSIQFLNFPIKDNVPPHIEAICIYPMDDASEVNGKKEPVYYPAVFSGEQFRLKDNPAIFASGNIGIGIETLDYYTDSWRKCGVYSILLTADGQHVFESRLDGFLFDHQRYLLSHIDFAMRKNTGKIVQKSFVDYNNKLDIYRTNRQRGAVEMIPEKNHEFRYEITDPAGNVSTLLFSVKGREKQPESTSFKPMKLNAVLPYSTEIDGFKVKFPANSFYTDVLSSFSVEPNEGIGFGDYFHVLDETIPIHKNFEITIPIPDEYKKISGLCGAKINKGKIEYAGGKISGQNMVITTREAGVYTLSADSIPPTIRLLNIPQNRNYTGRKEIRIEIKDNFSGIKDFRCTFDDKWQLFEYDAKNNVLIGTFDKMRIEKGKQHELKITVTDNVGNEGRVVQSIFF